MKRLKQSKQKRRIKNPKHFDDKFLKLISDALFEANSGKLDSVATL